jgi:protein TonB
MFVSIKNLLILGAVIAIHASIFVLGLLHSPNEEKKEVDVLQAELISPPPPSPPAPPKAETKPPPPPPKAAPPKLLSVAPAQAKASSKPQEQVKERPQEKSEVPTPSKTEATSSNESAKTLLDSPSPINSNQSSNNPLGLDVGIMEKSSIKILYMPEKERFYTSFSRNLNEEGKVGMQIYWNERGEVTNIIKTQSSNFTRLDNSAIEFAKRIRIEPYRINGTPSPVNATFYMVFKLYP